MSEYKKCYVRVIDVEEYKPFFAPKDGRARTLLLSCGHTKRAKASDYLPKRTHCRECYDAERARVSRETTQEKEES